MGIFSNKQKPGGEEPEERGNIWDAAEKQAKSDQSRENIVDESRTDDVFAADHAAIDTAEKKTFAELAKEQEAAAGSTAVPDTFVSSPLQSADVSPSAPDFIPADDFIPAPDAGTESVPLPDSAPAFTEPPAENDSSNFNDAAQPPEPNVYAASAAETAPAQPFVPQATQAPAGTSVSGFTGSAKNVRLGEVLIDYGYITRDQLEEALEKQKSLPTRKLLGDILEEMGFVTETQKLTALGKRLNIPLIQLDNFNIDPLAVNKIPKELALKYTLIGINIEGGFLNVACNDPLQFFALEDVRQQAKMPLKLYLAESSQIKKAIEERYSDIFAKQAASIANEAASEIIEEEVETDETDDAPIVRLLNNLLIKGYNSGASDIHIEPFDDHISVRLRIDGVLMDYLTLSKKLHQSLIARIKILSELDIAEKRVPQDGHFKTTLNGVNMSLRLSVIPTAYGEKAVLRYLTTNTTIDYVSTFGMDDDTYRKMMVAISSPHGIIYITGPTGSGKTTTLYMILEYLARKQVNITTIEDPVERNIGRVNQTQVNNAAGLTFESGLRSILRQDPDIVMVGETRDTETASISVRAAITGHLVLSTLHTNDAISSIVRLGDMGIPNYLIANSLVAIVAQRLVRKVCPECGYDYVPDDAEKAILGVDVDHLRKGKGCPFCNDSGYKGRMAIHEIVLIDRNIRNMISHNTDIDVITEYARKEQKMKTLRESATELVLNGQTTIEELAKTTYYEGM